MYTTPRSEWRRCDVGPGVDAADSSSCRRLDQLVLLDMSVEVGLLTERSVAVRAAERSFAVVNVSNVPLEV